MCSPQVLSQLPSAGGIATAGGLGFGMTATDPATVLAAELPDDADQLLDRPEYWVVNKDVCSPLDVADQLSFHLTTDGERCHAVGSKSLFFRKKIQFEKKSEKKL